MRLAGALWACCLCLYAGVGGSALTVPTLPHLRQRLSSALQSVREDAGDAVAGLLSPPDRLLAEAPIPEGERVFAIHGWRWHSRSVARDAGRLSAAAGEESRRADAGAAPEEAQRAIARLSAGVEFLWGFSWRGLRGIESELYFPWLRERLPAAARPRLDGFEEDRRAVESIGRELEELLRRCGATDGEEVGTSLQRISTLAQGFEERVRRLTVEQESYLVPLVAAYVRESEQKRFNMKVIASLGILKSRTFLVSFSETIKGDAAEEELFRKNIPRVARALVPRWRDQLYLPKTRCLEPLP